MKKSRNILKENRKIRKIRINALTIWIGFEVLLLIAVSSVIALRMVYGVPTGTKGSYTVPSENIPSLSVDDIELPKDLTGSGTVRVTEEPVGEKPDADTKDAGTEEAATEAVTEEVTAKTGDAAVTEQMIAGMNARQKADALIVTTPESLCNKVNVTIAGDIFREAYRNDMVSGLMFKESNFKSEEAGRQMLSAIHDLSKQLTGADVLISYRGQITDMSRLAARGVNLYCFAPDADNAEALMESAIQNNITPAFLVSLKDAAAAAPSAGLYIAQTDDVKLAVDAINAGRTFLYMTEDHKALRDGLVQAVSLGEISEDAINKAVEFALSVRISLPGETEEGSNE